MQNDLSVILDQLNQIIEEAVVRILDQIIELLTFIAADSVFGHDLDQLWFGYLDMIVGFDAVVPAADETEETDGRLVTHMTGQSVKFIIKALTSPSL